jgi:S-formylglutathione hydrolase FrmB
LDLPKIKNDINTDRVVGGLGIQGEDDAYDFGSGAGFYVDATLPPYDKGYNMYSYITEELPATVFEAFASQIDRERVSITGHSMGGHGALTLVRLPFNSLNHVSDGEVLMGAMGEVPP